MKPWKQTSATLFTILRSSGRLISWAKTNLANSRAESNVPAVACDSHPRRTNGFLTGCLLNVLRDYVRPTIEELPGHVVVQRVNSGLYFKAFYIRIFCCRIINVEMDTEKDRAKAFAGIECKADFIPAGSNIWMLPFLTKNWTLMLILTCLCAL